MSFPSGDGGVVSANLYGSGPRGVVLAPGGRFDKASWEPQAGVLAEAGFRVVLLAHSPIDHPERLAGRKLFIVSRGDTRGAGVPRLVAISDQYERAPEPKELVILEGSAHAQFLFQTDQGECLLREILRFLSAP